MEKVLLFEVCPFSSETEDFETPKVFARKLTHSLLAAPSTGGALTFSLNPLSSIPAKTVRDERGMTLAFSKIKPSFSLIPFKTVACNKTPHINDQIFSGRDPVKHQ